PPRSSSHARALLRKTVLTWAGTGTIAFPLSRDKAGRGSPCRRGRRNRDKTRGRRDIGRRHTPPRRDGGRAGKYNSRVRGGARGMAMQAIRDFYVAPGVVVTGDVVLAA